MKKDKGKSIITGIAFLMLICGFSCILYVAAYYYQGFLTKKSYETLAERFFSPEEDIALENPGDSKDNKAPSEAQKDVGIQKKLRELKRLNRDAVGWIWIQGTDINYPVVQHSDNEYYLTHDFEGKEDKHGCIFLDHRNSVGRIWKQSQTLILYGHNMKDRTMFGALKDFRNPTFFEEHHLIHFYCEKGELLYELTDLLDWQEGEESPYILESEENGIILSTCTYGNRRLILRGIRK